MNKKISLILVGVALIANVAGAEELLSLGKYTMNDGTMNVAFEVKQINGGRYFIEGGGSNAAGAMCMMNGIGNFEGALFQFGYKCLLTLTPVNGKLEIKDSKGCAPCDPGAYISGVYDKQK